VKGNPDAKLVGAACAVTAYLFWAGIPLYFKAVGQVPPLEVLAHRIVWTVVFLGALILSLGHGRRPRATLGDRRLMGMLVLSASIISVNWLIFIWAVANNRVLETSLGYFINPLITVVLAVGFLGERLRPWQWVAVLLAAVAVTILVIGYGRLPWVALCLALSFGFYGLIRKVAPVDGLTGLFVETLMVCPLALAYLIILAGGQAGTFGHASWDLNVLLMAGGVVTALPLVLFVEAAKRLRLSTMGFFQYIGPTGHFLLAIFVFGEPFTITHGITFALIWLALAGYSAEASLHRRRTIAIASDGDSGRP
jgi:chloramphenicol-sensitive protein RarD